VASEEAAYGKTPVNRALDASIHIGLTFLLATASLLILLPFIPLLTWGIIIAVALYPGFTKLERLLGGRGGLAAVLCTLILLGVLILPAGLLAHSLVKAIPTVTARLKDGTAVIPPPPSAIESWPIIGVPLKNLWGLASRDLPGALRSLAPQIRAALPGLLSASTGIALTVLQLVLSILVSGALLGYAHASDKIIRSLANRLFGAKGPEFQHLVGSTIRSVTFGVLGVALIQWALASLGFLVVGLPAASVWAAIFLVAAVLQVGVVVLIPAAIYVFVIANTTKAVIFLVWCIFVGVLDNVLRPLLLGRGVGVPVAVVLLGALGGLVALGIIGLFVGAVVLSVGYKLFLAWLEGTAAVDQAT